MPLSCKGRYRILEQSRGDIDDVLGNYTLTLVDSLDTLALFGKLTEFEQAVINVIANTNFDNDIIVSVFETNIRMIGGLLGGHLSALYIKDKYKTKYFQWYKNELLEKAKELGYKLLPAFKTTSGLPLPRINLKYGITQELKNSDRERFTCTACAGTLLIEFATLSRLTGDPIFERKARDALDYIWNKRNRLSDLVGTILNVHNGDWLNKDAGIGAGIDSYYEYLLKGYILLGDDSYLRRFNRHYDSIMKFMSQQHGSIMQTVHMHMPYRQARNYMDALLAFWPGLQVLKGDIKEAIKMHELLYQIVKKHKFLPEAFLSDNTVHWSNHPLRPEFLESTYFLYRATKDPYYLEIGKQIVEHLELYCRVPCGYAALSDVKTVKHEDRIDSFVYAETFKYLYLLFEEPNNLEIDVDEFLFTTEAHLIPLSLVNYKHENISVGLFNHTNTHSHNHHHHQQQHHSQHIDLGNIDDKLNHETDIVEHKSCESLKSMFKNDIDATKKLRQSVLRNHQQNKQQSQSCGSAGGYTTTTTTTTTGDATTSDTFTTTTGLSRLKASEFIAGNQQHMELLKIMGIKIQTMNDGRVQLVHNSQDALSLQDANNGVVFMNEMLELSKQKNFHLKNVNDDYKPVSLILLKQKFNSKLSHYLAGPAQFGIDLRENLGIFSLVEFSDPIEACTGNSNNLNINEINNSNGIKDSGILNAYKIKNKIVLTRRGGCMFIDKVRTLEQLKASAVIIYDNNKNTSFISSPLFAMSSDGVLNVRIPSVFLFRYEADDLISKIKQANNKLIVYMGVNNANLIEKSFYSQLNQLKNIIKYEFNNKTKSNMYKFIDNVLIDVYNINKYICTDDDYSILMDFYDYFNLNQQNKVILQMSVSGDFTNVNEEKLASLDDKSIIEIYKNKLTSQLILKINIDNLMRQFNNEHDIENEAINAHIDVYALRLFELLKHKFESHTNLYQLQNFNDYFTVLYKLIKTYVYFKQQLSIKNFDYFNDNDQLLLNDLATKLQSIENNKN